MPLRNSRTLSINQTLMDFLCFFVFHKSISAKDESRLKFYKFAGYEIFNLKKKVQRYGMRGKLLENEHVRCITGSFSDEELTQNSSETRERGKEMGDEIKSTNPCPLTLDQFSGCCFFSFLFYCLSPSALPLPSVA